MFSKKEVLTMVNVLMLSVAIGTNVDFGSVENENVEPDKMTILSSDIESVEHENVATNYSELDRKVETPIEDIRELKDGMVMNEHDVWAINHDSEYLMYVPTKAKKGIYNDVEYFYLNDNQGGMYIIFSENLVDGGNYILEVGRYSDDVYDMEFGGFEFDEESEQAFEDYSIMDSKVAEKMVAEMLFEI